MIRDLFRSVRPLVLSCGIVGTNAGATEPDVSLRQEFAAPPSEYRALPIRSGRALSNPKLPDWLADRHAGGVVLDVSTTKGKGPEPFTDPRYLDDPVVFQQLRDMMTRLKPNDQKVWIYDELGYPSGNAGGLAVQYQEVAEHQRHPDSR